MGGGEGGGLQCVNRDQDTVEERFSFYDVLTFACGQKAESIVCLSVSQINTYNDTFILYSYSYNC